MNLLHILIRLARRGRLALCALFALLALLGTQALPVSAATTPSFIRLINASPDVGTVDVFVDGARFSGNARFAGVTDYLQLPSGPHKVELALIGKGVGAAVIVQQLSVQAGAAYTVAAIGTKATGLSLQVFVDDNRMVSGMATVRVYDLSPQSGTLSVAAGTNKLIGPVSYRRASNYQRLGAGLYTFTFSSSQPAFTLVDQVTLKTDMVTSLFLVGVLNGAPPLQVVHVQVKGLPRLLAGTGSDPNVLSVKASEFAPFIAFPLGVLALAGIAVGLFTRFWPFSRQKGSSRPRPRELFRAALGAILALILTLGGLSFAFFMSHPAPTPSARLLIPAIGVNATIESVGVQRNGAMDTARQGPWSDVGLYAGGPRPGDRGSAVIAGHLDRPGGNPAVFWRLRELHVGDEMRIINAQGKILLFHVTRIEAYPVQDVPVQDIFGNTTGRFLNLTTCAGDWIPTQHQRAIRLVVYTSVGPAPANTSTGTSSALLTSPSSSSNSTSSAAARSPTSSSVSSAPTPTPTATLLPVAIRQSVTVKLPGISHPTSRQPTRTPVGGTLLHRANRPLAQIPVVGKVLHQASRQLTHIPVVGTLLHRASRQLTHIPVGGTLLHRASRQLTHIPVGGTLLHRASRQLTHIPVGGTLLHRASRQLTHIPVGGTLLHRASRQLTHTPVGGTLLHRASRQLTHTPVGGKVLHQASTQLTRTPVGGKVLHRTSTQVGGKVLHRTSTQVTHTPVGGKVLHRASTQLTRTPVGGKVLHRTSTRVTHIPVGGKVLHQPKR